MADPSTYRPATGTIPVSPGVYRFRDPQGRVVYVGKAINLRSRLNSYFQDFSALHPRTQKMLTTASSVDWLTVGNEVEALVLEYSWIKEYSPRFNVRFRDDKTYPYLAVTVGEEYPRVAVVREAKRKGTRYFGPYTQVWAIKATLEELIRVFPVRSCRNGVFNQAKRSGRACLLGYIDKCSAPCVGRISVEDYNGLVNQLMRFLSGQTREFVDQISQQMQNAADNEDFESAAKWRDRLAALEKVLERNSVVFEDSTDADLLAFYFDELHVGVQIIHVRVGRITGERFFVVERIEELDEPGYVERILTRVYSDIATDGVPKEVLLSRLPSNQAALANWLVGERGSKVDLRTPQRGDKRALMATAIENCERALTKSRLEKSADITVRTQALNDLQDVLELPEPPLRIECIDISTLAGTQTVGSLVVFEDGLPKKSDYRKFIIKGDRKDDLSSVYEVVSRRFKEQSHPQDSRFAYEPSLLVIDGAAGQVKAAVNALQDCGVTVPVVGLAKRLEEVWVVNRVDPIIFARNSHALHLLQRVRDEAHRAAISHHRQRRSSTSLQSQLDEIPGVGPVLIKALLKAFGSVKKLREASAAELSGVPGVGLKTAEVIWKNLHPEGS
ncbi:MAG: excinuclease ABC subunit UvrC [Candidatus Nanopelagicales bacterium]|jgi:excinuclease ABC subunit C